MRLPMVQVQRRCVGGMGNQHAFGSDPGHEKGLAVLRVSALASLREEFCPCVQAAKEQRKGKIEKTVGIPLSVATLLESCALIGHPFKHCTSQIIENPGSADIQKGCRLLARALHLLLIRTERSLGCFASRDSCPEHGAYILFPFCRKGAKAAAKKPTTDSNSSARVYTRQPHVTALTKDFDDAEKAQLAEEAIAAIQWAPMLWAPGPPGLSESFLCGT